MARRDDGWEETALKLGAVGAGALTALFVWPVTGGLLIGGALLSRAWLLGVLPLGAGVLDWHHQGWTAWSGDLDTLVAYLTRWSDENLRILLEIGHGLVQTPPALANPGVSALLTLSRPLFLVSVGLGAILGALWARNRRSSRATGAKRGDSAGPSPQPPSGDHPPSTSESRPASPPPGKKAAAVWTVDGGLPPGLGVSGTSWVRCQGWQWRFRYRVAQSGIFGWGGSPRYRVLHGKGGVGGLFTRFRTAALHGSGAVHGTDTRFWDVGYTVAEQATRYTRFQRVTTLYRVARAIHGRMHAPLYTVAPPTLYLSGVQGGDTPLSVQIRDVSRDSRLPDQTDSGTETAPDGQKRAPTAHESPTQSAIPDGGDWLPVHPAHHEPSQTGAEPGSWVPGIPLGTVLTIMAPPKSGKSTVLTRVGRAILTGGDFLDWPAGLSGLVWLAEEDRQTFAYKRARLCGRLAVSASGSDPDSDSPLPQTPTTMAQDGADGYELDPDLAERLCVLYGPNLPTGLPHLCAAMAEAVQMCRLRETVSGIPWRTVVVDSLFFWCPEAETDVQAAGRVMALLKSAASLGYRVILITHADPESGKQKGPQQLWRQTDFRVHLTAPEGHDLATSPLRELRFSGRFPDGRTPPPVTYCMGTDGELRPVNLATTAQDAAAAPRAPERSAAPRGPVPVDRLLAALPLDGSTVPLGDVVISGMGRSRVYDLAQEAEDTGRAMRVVIGRRGKLGIKRILPESGGPGSHATADAAP